MCVLNGNNTRTQAKSLRHNAHISRPKQEKKRNLPKQETLGFQETPLARQTQKTHKTHNFL